MTDEEKREIANDVAGLFTRWARHEFPTDDLVLLNELHKKERGSRGGQLK